MGQDNSTENIQIWGTEGSKPWQLNDQAGIVLDLEGFVLVVDTGNNTIQKFASNGTFLDEWGTAGAGPGQFSNPTGMTVQFPQGNVFVADSGNSRIQQFDNDGNFMKEYSVGEEIGDITNIDLDVDSDGKIYFTDRDLGVIKVISP